MTKEESITIIDYGMGNLGSIFNMLRKLGLKASISSKEDDIAQAHKLILPGVGAFDNGMTKLKEMGLLGILNQKVLKDRIPILGVCLGMQLLTEKSEEGSLPGLGWIKGETVRFRFPDTLTLKIPHMGWNTVTIEKESPLFEQMFEEPRFYFVHSYHVVPENDEDILTKTHYGYEFVSTIVRDNIAGVQFHPEKSHKFGMQVLRNFAEKF